MRRQEEFLVQFLDIEHAIPLPHIRDFAVIVTSRLQGSVHVMVRNAEDGGHDLALELVRGEVAQQFEHGLDVLGAGHDVAFDRTQA
jgi:hypothetical protein